MTRKNIKKFGEYFFFGIDHTLGGGFEKSLWKAVRAVHILYIRIFFPITLNKKNFL